MSMETKTRVFIEPVNHSRDWISRKVV